VQQSPSRRPRRTPSPRMTKVTYDLNLIVRVEKLGAAAAMLETTTAC